MAEQYKFYIIFHGNDLYPEQTEPYELNEHWNAHYAKFEGLLEDGEIKNIYTEDYADAPKLRLYIPPAEDLLHKSTECELTLLWKKNMPEAYRFNLLQYTNAGTTNWVEHYSNTSWGTNYVNAPFHLIGDTETNGVKLVNDTGLLSVSAQCNQMALFAIPRNVLKRGKEYTLSFKISSTATTIPQLHIVLSLLDNVNARFTTNTNTFVADGKMEFKIVIPETTAYDLATNRVAIQFYIEKESTRIGWEEISIWDLMLVEGDTISKDWIASPFDTPEVTEQEQKFYNDIKGRLIEYHDTFRNRYWELLLTKQPAVVGEHLYGGQRYREVSYTFTNVYGTSFTESQIGKIDMYDFGSKEIK